MKYSTSRQAKSPKSGSGGYSTYKDRQLWGKSPEKAQEEAKPTPEEAVRLQKRLAGCP